MLEQDTVLINNNNKKNIRLWENNKCYLKFNIYFNTLLEVFHNFKKSYRMAFLSL